MLNGYAATKEDWDPGFLGALAEDQELILPDNPGMGDLAASGPPDAIAPYALAAAAALDEAGLSSAAVLGWSMGGFIAQELAAIRPHQVEALVLLSTDGGGPGSVPADPATWGELTSHEGTPAEQAERLLGLILPASFVAGLGEEALDAVATARAALSVPALEAQERAMDAWRSASSAERLAAIAAPALVAAGGDDRVIPARNADLLAAELGDSWLARFPGGEHAFQAQEPARLAALIAAFLDRR